MNGFGEDLTQDIVLKDLVQMPNQTEQLRTMVDILLDAGLEFGQDVVYFYQTVGNEEAIVVVGKNNFTISYIPEFHLDDGVYEACYQVSHTMRSFDEIFGHTSSLVMESVAESQLDSETRKLLVRVCKESLARLNTNQEMAEYFANRIEYVKNQLNEINAEFLAEYGKMISTSDHVKKLSEIGAVVFGMQHNGKTSNQYF